MTIRTPGFTLLEMLVVLGIMGLVAGIGYPAISRSIAVQAFQTEAKQIDLAVRRARGDAIREQRTVAVPLFVDGRDDASFSLFTRMPASAMRIDQPERILFYRDGSTNGGKIALTAGQRIFRIVIDPQTGVVTSGAQ